MNEQMLPELVRSSQVINAKHYSAGSVFLVKMTEEMIVVLCYLKFGKEPIYSRVYFSNNENMTSILGQAKKQFKIIKECLLQKKVQLIEELE